MLIGKYLTLDGVCKSSTAIRLGIENKPNQQQIMCLESIAENVYDKCCEKFLVKIPITSAFRSKELNSRISNSSRTSQHCLGQAFDLDLDGVLNGPTNTQLFNYIRFCLDFDQLIWEFGTDNNPDWVHVSYDITGRQRRNVLKTVSKNNSVSCIPF